MINELAFFISSQTQASMHYFDNIILITILNLVVEWCHDNSAYSGENYNQLYADLAGFILYITT